MKLFEANFDTILLRFYLLMAVVIVPFLIGLPMLALLALPVFLTAILGVTFKNNEESKVKNLRKETQLAKGIAA